VKGKKMAVSLEEERVLNSKGFKYICAIDESGMGCFAGDVFVGAVILPENINFKELLPGINDSKKKTSDQRNILYKQIIKHSLVYSIASASVAEIDEINIYWARFLACRRAIDNLKIKPDFVIIDGNATIPEIDMPQKAIVKGDAKSVSIAAASILAKIARDEHIDKLSELVHEDYGWIKNKSYYSKEHVDAIIKYGKTIYHRKKYVAKYL
jgi:ribonuclease HII